jgi:hypothetical protein
MLSALEVIQSQLASATTFVAIFGALPPGDERAQLAHLKKKYRALVRMTHPDQVPAGERTLAHAVFPILVRFYEDAVAALRAGHYDRPRATAAAKLATAAPDVVMKSAIAVYTVKPDLFAVGDFGNLHLGHTNRGEAVLLKVAAELGNNAFLAKEATFYKGLAARSDIAGLRRYLPDLLDSFSITERPGEQFRVNVFRYTPGYVSLTTIHEAYPKGLDPKDAAWIWRRLIAQALAAQTLGVVHGAIVPDHVLVHPGTHEPLHLGWVHSVERPQERQARLTTVIDRWRDWYPKEIFAREIPSLQTDLYMVGKTMIYLAGGDVAGNRFPRHYPEVMKDTVAQLIAEESRDRPRDGHALLREFTTGVRKIWGTAFRPLVLPK